MNLLPLLLAAALSAGNAEFERSAADGAAEIAVGRIVAELGERGPAAGGLERAMLQGGARFASRAKAKELCRGIFEEELKAEFRARVKDVCDRLGLGEERRQAYGNGPEAKRLQALDARFEAAFERERASACEKQARGIAGAVKPTEAEFELKDEATLRGEMTEKVVARQKTPVFEENVRYISETIVDPVIESARKEMKRQREYLTRTKCEAYAPSALAKEIEANLRKNVEERRTKEPDPSKAWGVFPKTLESALPAAVERRTLERVAKGVEDVKVAVDAESILKTIASDPAAHRTADGSERIFRGIFAGTLLGDALARASEEAPAKERGEFAEYVKARASSPEVVRAVESRIRRDVLPKWKAARAAAAKSESRRIWPTLADRTWYPDAELADIVVARSDYAQAVKAWRTVPALEALAKADGGKPVMEEAAADADRSVSAAFDLARNAIAAQNAIVGEMEPSVLREARDRKSSFWRATPDFKAIVGMLTSAVEARWDERRVATLWRDGETRPENAKDQHAVLFPSVRRRIELVARSILEEIRKPEPETKAESEKPQEDRSESDQRDDERPKQISIVVERAGDRVTVRLESGKSTVAERSAKARMSDYRDAMKFVSDKLGAEILKLK